MPNYKQITKTTYYVIYENVLFIFYSGSTGPHHVIRKRLHHLAGITLWVNSRDS